MFGIPCDRPREADRSGGLVSSPSAGRSPSPTTSPRSPTSGNCPYAMHSEMSERPTITVGRAGADLIGADNRALQAAVDYVAGLGGGSSRSARAST